jgi:hypothetical protein
MASTINQSTELNHSWEAYSRSARQSLHLFRKPENSLTALIMCYASDDSSQRSHILFFSEMPEVRTRRTLVLSAVGVPTASYFEERRQIKSVWKECVQVK